MFVPRRWVIGCLFGALLLGARWSAAQDKPAGERERAEAKKLFAYFDAQAKRFEARLDSGVALEREGESIFNWTIDRSWHGSFFVWTANGRPALVGCFLSDSTKPDLRSAYVELYSMADQPLAPVMFTTTAQKKYEWSPRVAQNATIPVHDRPAPAKQERLRRAQMRELAEQFEVTMFREADSNDTQEELRLMAKPLYRYPASKDGSLEGAMFAYLTTKGTDPEFLLAVECDPRKETDAWRVRPIRSCTRKLELRRDGTVVWTCAPYTEALQQTKLSDPYVIIKTVEVPTSEFEALREATIGGSQARRTTGSE